jgi:CRISPR-associated endonuclease Csn1
MKKILGLDLGTTSIGWALVNEAEEKSERSVIIKTGVRVNPLTVDEQMNFEKGKSITSNADRTLKRSMRRNLQRYKLRRDNLIEALKSHNIISDDTILSEEGNHSTFNTYKNRAKASTQAISLGEFSKVLLMINKKRGYKSSRKAKSQDEGQLIDGMEVAKQLYDNDLTPGQFSYQLLKDGKKYLPDFYRSDLQNEFDKIWKHQTQFYPEILNDDNKAKLTGLSKTLTRDFFQKTLKIDLSEIKGKEDKKLKAYEWRAYSISQQLTIHEVAFVLTEINNQINGSSGYLGAISDRSKELIFNKLTVGQYLYDQINQSPHARLKGQVFYRQDYLDEFNTLWEEQAKHHSALTPELKCEIRDIVIFYQRKLKSQKGLISFCEFDSRKTEIDIDGKKKTKTIGARVCPRSSPLFQEFKIWQILNNIELTKKKTKERYEVSLEQRQYLFKELGIKEKLTDKQVIEFLVGQEQAKDFEVNYKSIDGNRTNAALCKAYMSIVEVSGHGEYEFEELTADELYDVVANVFQTLKINTNILYFNSDLESPALEQQPYYQLWHLLYSYEEDDTNTGTETLLRLLKEKFGFEKEYAKIMANIVFQDDYGSLSSKAIKKIMPFLKEGNTYDQACLYSGYNHSRSLSKEEQVKRPLKDKLEILPKNSLRNPVVEKILNQMVHVVNLAIESFGKPKEVRIELARELKNSAKEREEMTTYMTAAKDDHDKYRKILKEEFGLSYVSRNDIIRYKLYLELASNGYKTLYTDTYIEPNKLFSKDFDIEHIIPQSRLFDDSFSNKTLETRSANIEKADSTAYDFVMDKFGGEGIKLYENRLEKLLYAKGDRRISKGKYKKLLMKGTEIPEGFINRDIRNTQYIAKKAKSMLEEVFREVTTTTGSITSRLREDWQLVDVLQELNWDKYRALGLTYYQANKEGKQLPRIKDWTKRNDHRHHAMDALTVAFTKYSHVQYLNNLNARSDKSSSIYGIEQKELYRDERNKLRFKPPIPLDDFRAEAKKHLEATLISFKSKNKVVTKNKNTFKTASGEQTKIELTPRGQLHLETVYGSSQKYISKEEKVGGGFTVDTINKIAKKIFREALLKRLTAFDSDPKKAFTGKNSLDKNPIYLDDLQTKRVPEKVKLVWQETVYTIRKDLSPNLFKDSKKNDDFLNRVEDVFDNAVKEALKKHYTKTQIEVEAFNQTVTKEKNKKKVLDTAFTNLRENPVWLNKEKGLCIKRVTLEGISNAVALHHKKDKNGKAILDEDNRKIETDFVATSNNHHVAIYKDENGALQEKIVTFYEAVARVNQGLPTIDKEFKHGEGWKFLFTMKQNEYFVLPNENSGFTPFDIELTNPDNYALISPNLFRVQTISIVKYGNNIIRDFKFRHHLETTLNDNKELKEITYRNIKSLAPLEQLVKVRLNHLGQIVQVGEY